MNLPNKPNWLSQLSFKPSQLILIGLFGFFVSGVLLLALIALILTPTLPAIDNLTENHLKVPMRVYTEDSQLIAEFGEEKRIPVKKSEVPDLLVKAILAAEDDSFYTHQGVDFSGIARAALSNLRSHHSGEGGSTITMQVARNYFLSPEKTYTRKIKEILLAFKIERQLTKDQILELYLNKIFLGNRAYGFAAAAEVYYGKSLAQLNLAEMAMLAGLPKAPSSDNPISNPENATARRDYVLRRMLKLHYIDDIAFKEAQQSPVITTNHPLRYNVEGSYVAEMARQYVLQRYDQKAYTEGLNVYTTINAKDQQAANQALRDGLLTYDQRHGYRKPVGHEELHGKIDPEALDDVLKDYHQVADLIPAVVVKVDEKAINVYSQDGVTVAIGWAGLSWARPYIDENSVGPEPKKASDIVTEGDIVYIKHQGQEGWRLTQIPQVSGALVSLRPRDGAIVALTGGFDFYQSNYNRVMQAERQPGSNFKPFVYSAALEKGFTAASLISGAPIVVEDANLEEEWRPEDYSRKFFGLTRLRKALTLSLNLVSVRLLRAIGPGYAVEYVKRFGFDPNHLPRNLSLVLGTASVTPIQIVSAFAVFANGGYKVEPYFISRIEDTNHKILEQTNPLVACEPPCSGPADIGVAQVTVNQAAPNNGQGTSAAAASPTPAATPAQIRPAPRVISAENDFIMTSIMRDVITQGTGQAAMQLGRKDLAGKTGTTNDHRDAWFSGFNADMVTTAWVGFDQPAPLGNGEVGGRVALPIWMDYMRVALQGVPEKPLTVPAGIVTATINSDTGKITDASDPKAMSEYFMKDALPNQVNNSVGDNTPGSASPASPTSSSPPENAREGLF